MSWPLDLWNFIRGPFQLLPPSPPPQSAPAAPVAKPPVAPPIPPATPAPSPPLARPSPSLPDSHGISDAAFNLIVTEEDSNAAYYTRHYEHFEWPEGASGPTIGIGFDCGYVTTAQARVDWDGFVDQNTINAILLACGLRGVAAENWVRQHGGSVTITWDQAIAQFRTREIPQWEAKCRADLPNFDDLSPDCRGVLVSLAYNRGASFDLPGSRYAEMRAIRAHMIAKNFAAIPADILSMQRFWPKGGDLWNRRAHEATLFQKGLSS